VNTCVEAEAANATVGTVAGAISVVGAGVGATVGVAVGATDGVELGAVDGVELGVDGGVAFGVELATGAGVDVVSADAGATNAASERLAAIATAVSAARVFFMMFGFSLGEGFFGYAHDGNVKRRRGDDVVIVGTI
jgi:hypothetical protein